MKPDEVLRRAAAKYEPQGRVAAGWALGKLRGDPAYAAVLELTVEVRQGGSVLDVGCGDGYLLAALAVARPDLELHGLDHDAARLAQARRALPEARVRLEPTDVRRASLPRADLVVLLDVLHYLPPVEQDRLLQQLAACVRARGALVIRDAAAGEGWRSWVTWLFERLFVWLGRHRGAGVYFRTQQELVDAVARTGLAAETRPCREGTPMSNVLVVGRRPGGP